MIRESYTLDTWRKDALFAITKGDVESLTEGRDITDIQRAMIHKRIENMDASFIMEQVGDLIDDALKPPRPPGSTNEENK